MTNLDTAREHVDRAPDLACLLNASYSAFTLMLSLIRREQDRGGLLFPAFVMAGVPAASGRKTLAAAPSLTVAANGPTPQMAVDPALPGEEVALAIAKLSETIACRLGDAVLTADDPADRHACAEAARQAWELHVRLGGAQYP